MESTPAPSNRRGPLPLIIAMLVAAAFGVNGGLPGALGLAGVVSIMAYCLPSSLLIWAVLSFGVLGLRDVRPALRTFLFVFAGALTGAAGGWLFTLTQVHAMKAGVASAYAQLNEGQTVGVIPSAAGR